MRKLAFLVAVIAVAASQRAGAWWLTGHTVINRTGVATLPGEVPDFLRRQIDWLGARSTAPDSWRDATEPSLQAIEIPNHIWYLEALPPMSGVPRSRNNFIVIEFVDRIELTEKDIRNRVPAAQTLADPFTAFLAYLDRSHARVEQVYALDQKHAFEGAGDHEARELVYASVTDAAAMLRDLIYTAWTASSI